VGVLVEDGVLLAGVVGDDVVGVQLEVLERGLDLRDGPGAVRLHVRRGEDVL
jgi:hypothetical protein